MLVIDMEEQEFFDSERQMFVYESPCTVRLEHSLISISRWEAKWHKPYLPSIYVPGIQGPEEELDYIRCMIIGKTDEGIPRVLMTGYKQLIEDYISNPHSASTVHRIGEGQQGKLPRKTITSEIIYYWMLRFGIPLECDKWHFNRLLMLIDTFNIHESAHTKGNKMSQAESAKWRYQLNQQRLAQS